MSIHFFESELNMPTKTIILPVRATIWGQEGCAEKSSDIKWSKILNCKSWPYQNEIEMLQLQGVPKVNEVVFFHKSTRSLVTTDLVFNIQKPKGWAAFIVLGLAGTYKKFGISRILLNIVKDQSAFLGPIKEIKLRRHSNNAVSRFSFISTNFYPYRFC